MNRLICEIPGHATQTCLFDSSPGEKKCDDGLTVKVEERKAQTYADVVLACGPRGMLELTWWDDYFWYKKNKGTYSCRISAVNADDEKLIAQMPTTHPRTWRLIQDRLDERFDEYQTFRGQALSYLKKGLRDDEMWPFILTEICFEESNHPETIPELDVPENFSPDDLWYMPTELKTCTYVTYKQDPVLREYTFDVELDRGCFWNTLVDFIPQTPYRTPQDGVVDILDLGCGMASGAAPLVSYFKKYGSLNLPPLGPLNQTFHYTGVDLSQEEIEKAKKINPESETFSFVTDDSDDFFQERPYDQFDVILFRHPGPIKEDWHGDGSLMWYKSFRDAFEHLSENGVMIITTYYAYEYLFAKHVFENESGAHIYLAGENPSSFKKDYLDRDKYLIVVGKQPPSNEDFSIDVMELK
jgi:hypothetical protein